MVRMVFISMSAAAPIIEKSSINFDKVYLKSRYDKGEAAYLNCPMTKEEFEAFHKEFGLMRKWHH